MFRKIQRIVTSAFALSIAVGALLGLGGTEAHALVEGQTEVIVNKVKFSEKDVEDDPKVSINNDGTVTGTYENTGGTIPALEGKEKVKGAEFTVYDATAKYQTLMAVAGTTVSDALTAISTGGTTGLTAVSGAVGRTDSNGQVKFELDNFGSDGKPKVYLIVETDAPPFISNYSQPIALMLPMSNNGVTLTQFNIYPKNIEVKPIKELDETKITVNGEEVGTFDVGAPIKYYTEFLMPTNINKDKADGTGKLYTKFEIADTPSANLKFKEITSIEYYNGTSWVDTGLAENTDYTIASHTGTAPLNGEGFKLTFDLPDALAKMEAFAGNKVRVNYTMHLKDGVVPEEPEDNEVTIDFTHDGTDYSETDPGDGVITGGRRFRKVDSESTPNGLEGAEFVIKREIGTTGTYEYAQFRTSTNTKITNVNNTDNAASVVWGAKADASVLVSSANGGFTVSGLDFGSYVAEEIKAPSGHVLPQNPDTAFTIGEGSWGTTNILQIVNYPEGTLPQTGGKGIFAFLLIGSLLMAAAIIWYKRTKKKAAA